MLIIHFLLNGTIVAIELGLVAGIGWLAWKTPLVMSGLTAGLALVLGLRLEIRRLGFEMPFYFERAGRVSGIFRAAVGGGHALLKATVAGIVAVMTFSGTEQGRLQVMAGIFAACVLVGSMLLRRLTISFGAKPAHWGFFRMGAPLGLLFSAAMSFFPPPTSVEVARKVLLDLPARPSIAQGAEALFSLRLWIDDLLVRLLASHVGPDWAKMVGIVVGSNMLAGFVIAVYAVAIAEVVRILEEAHWRLRGIGGRRV
ncbi:MAG: hypothetical protein SFW09_00210 [Hyphomicrobiaceae bacterium]|nr:hypothetical protein [Hyphomicrobiaceae bacterium]